MEALIRDMGYAFRRLLAQPGSTLIIILTLAFGIGVNTSIFSLVNGVLFKELPFKRGGDIVEIRQTAIKAGVDNTGASALDVKDFREQNRSLEDVIEYHFMYFFIAGQSPALVKSGIVSANYFDFLGVKPALGRSFVASDDAVGAEPVVILSHEFWNSHFSADPDVVGKTLEMNGKANRVVGVLPRMPQFPEVNDIYMPTSGCPTRGDAEFINTRSSRMMSMYGRTKPGVSLQQAGSDLDMVAKRLHSTYPADYPAEAGFGVKVLSLQNELTKDIRPSLLLLLAASLLVLFITCTNVVNLTLAQQSRRQKELAVRAALGADRIDIAKKLLVESMMLALAGGAGGLLLAYFSLDLLTSFAATFTSRASEVSIDGQALAFNLVVSVATGLIVGLAPVFGKQDIVTALKEGGAHATLSRQRQKVRKLLIVGQIAIAFMLVTGAGLMIRSFVALQRIDPGFRSDDIAIATIPLDWNKYDPGAIRNFVRELRNGLSGSPEVQGVAFTTAYPFGSGIGVSLGTAVISFDDRAADAGGGKRVNFRTVSGNYFELLGIPLVAGRYISDSDDENATPVAVLSRAMAEKYWPGESPLNKRISPDQGKTWLTVVGVVQNIKGAGFDKPPIDEYYVSYAQSPSQSVNVLLRTKAAPNKVSALVKAAVARVDANQPVTKVTTLARVMSDTLSTPRMLSQVLSLFSFLALTISMVGVSGLLAFTVSQRTKELGIRMALGAEPHAVRRMILGQGLVLVAVGLVLGMVGSLLLGRLLASLIYGISSSDVFTFVLVTFLFLAVSLAACWLPAARASRLDPNAALRTT
ncbi:ABC transporter permease [Tahibacter harae]|uniref:ABC transporter permease n=1 Tax=Tahibacter harae TaxID=2963937 RepID=A0ABT1QP09_9GAMM|nr:ABC transporter permease [Tahibacter harae]MCQ4163592.1 ABC transporter permease [Tahibacter harae]